VEQKTADKQNAQIEDKTKEMPGGEEGEMQRVDL
jgi:hypothetical protein